MSEAHFATDLIEAQFLESPSGADADAMGIENSRVARTATLDLLANISRKSFGVCKGTPEPVGATFGQTSFVIC
ncbi:hypothetical protein LOZ58_000861 [Ophidiomyces ophidiicola]|nr:hypothetical protein LOZ65_000756 [Ophidiomyces ophidiicola]KAI1943967.1 hypothetical protein LOZ66_000555 [Ophidiomyces ophidiicola]KAI1965960.1 hypothetical protein LOZ58_000861 [Ophidiomyces ophidiicola]